ncbi:hypothetical protein [Rhodococcus phenolicus]|uniref:hypothetical protein n=1 Tax=Rhodococcus phenolicus TaxID=263849 RepID=UPI00082A319D|nr:hypothetical protein [Rhodococcus phenolicus]
MSDLHLIYTTYGPDFGWSLTSPQVPELIGGRNSISELLADTPDILRFAGVADYPHTWRHEQHFIRDDAGDEFFIRFLADDDTREGAANRMHSELQAGADSDLIERGPVMSTGERLLIAVTGSDTIGWCEDQLEPDTGAMLGYHAGDDLMYHMPILNGRFVGRRSWQIEELGLTRASTVAQLVDALLAGQADDLLVQSTVRR